MPTNVETVLARAVHAAVRRFTAEHASPPLAALIGLQLDAWESELAESAPIASVLAPTTARAFGARSVHGEGVGAATWSFFLGSELLERVRDGSLPPAWDQKHGVRAKDVATLAGLALVQSVPATILAETELPLETRARLGELFASSAWTMIEGQLRDVVGGELIATLDLAESMVSQKSGFRARLFAIAGVIAARSEVPTISHERAAAIERFAVALGTAGELAALQVDLFGGPICKALLRGKRTWPLLRALEHLAVKAPAERRRLEMLLVEARSIERHHDVLAEIRSLLTAADAATLTALRVELWLARARRALRDAELVEPELLAAFVDRLSPQAAQTAGAHP